MTTPSFLMSEPQHQYFLGEMARLKPKSNCSAGYRGVRANWYPFVFTAKIIAMHPSNSLLVPILHKHSERLLRAQIEAHAKELGPEDRKKFLGKQFDAVTDAISEKLAMSYKDAPVLPEWDSNVIKSSIKSWVIFLAGEANFTLGIDDFSLGVMQLELGRPVSFSAITPSTQTEVHGHRNEGVFVNGYRVRRTLSKVESKLCVILGPERYTGNDIQSFDFVRQSGNELEDMLLVLGGRAQKQFGEPGDTTLKTLITHFLTP
jgi:hypothetical protein